MAGVSEGVFAPIWSNKYKEAVWRFTWSSTYVSPGITKITWELRTVGRDESPKKLETRCLFKILDGTGEEIYKNTTWDKDNSGDDNRFNNWYRDSGDFNIAHGADGAASFKVYMKGRTYEIPDSYYVSEQVFNVTENFPYTNCGAPTSVSISESVCTPSGSITINWSGATAGTANQIKGYQIEYKIGDSAWTAGIAVNLTSSSGNYTFNLGLNDSFRGKTIQARVKTLGNINNYDSEFQVGGGCIVNVLPDKPTISITQSLFPSSVSSIRFSTLRAGALNEGGSSGSIWYATVQNGTKNIITNTTDVPLITGSNTFYFWTYDGYEYSSASTSITVTRNSKPEVSISIQGTQFIEEELVFENSNGQSNNTYLYGLQYSKKADFSQYTDISLIDKYIGDVRRFIALGLDQNKTYYYRYWVQRHDGLETSDMVFSERKAFTVDSFEVKSYINPEGFENYFAEELVLSHYQGSNRSNYRDLNRPKSFTNIAEGQRVTQFTLPCGTESKQASGTYKINLTDKQQKFRIKNLEEVLDFKSEWSSSNRFKPYTSPTLTIETNTVGKEYGVNGSFDITINNITISPYDSSNDSTLFYQLTPDILWGKNGIASSVANDGIADKVVMITVANAFGQTKTQELVLYFDFQEPPEIGSIEVKVYDYSDLNSGNKDENIGELDDFTDLKEGARLKPDTTIEYYGRQINCQFYYKESDGTKKVLTEVSEYNDDVYISPWEKKADTGGWVKKPRICDFSSVGAGDFGEISQNTDVTFYIMTSTEYSNKELQCGQAKLYAHVPPQGTFVNVNYMPDSLGGEKSKIKGKVKLLSFGYENTLISTELAFSSRLSPTSAWEEPFLTLKRDEDVQDQKLLAWEFEKGLKIEDNNDYIQMQLKIETTVSLSHNGKERFQTTKAFESTEFYTVYNILPTVAYRSNCVGINTNDPTDGGEYHNTAFVINAYKENDTIEAKNRVYFRSSKRTAAINLIDGALENFITDCGSWDDTEGMLAVNPEADATTFAPIAYTGEIKDLEQEEKTTIVFFGGNSVEI